MRTSHEETMGHTKADAVSYILTLLLQRLEAQNPGTLKEILEGVKSDQTAVSGTTSEHEHVTQVFQEALGLLEKVESLSSDTCLSQAGSTI